MSAKNVDLHNRWRSKTIAFRVTPEENEQITARFLAEHPDFQLQQFDNCGYGSWLRVGELRFDPCDFLNEGFYIACFRKVW